MGRGFWINDDGSGCHKDVKGVAMCSKHFTLAVFFLVLSSASWSQSAPSFSDQVSSALGPVSQTLSPDQANLLIPVFQLYEDRLASLQTDLDALSTSLVEERKARELDKLVTSLEFLGLGTGLGIVATVIFVLVIK